MTAGPSQEDDSPGRQTPDLEFTLKIREAQLEKALNERDRARNELADARREISAVTDAAGFRLLQRIRRGIDRVAPWGTRRRGLVLALSRTIYIALTEGSKGVGRRLRYFRRWSGRFWKRAPTQAPSMQVYGQYELWLAKNSLTGEDIIKQRSESENFSYRPLISILTPVYNTPEDILTEAIESVCAQTYGHWELCLVDDASPDPASRRVLSRYENKDPRIKIRHLDSNRGIAGASQEALDMSSGEFVTLLDHDDELKPDALFEVVKLLNDQPALDFIYTDEDKRDQRGNLVDPFFKPQWSPDLLLSMNYITHLSVFRRSLAIDVGGFRRGYDGSQDYDLQLRITENTDRIAHIPKPLYTWRKAPGSAAGDIEAKPYAEEAAKRALSDALLRRGIRGRVESGHLMGRYRIRYEVIGEPDVAIIIPTRDQLEMLNRCLASVRRKTDYRRYEILVIDNDSSEPATLRYLEGEPDHVLRFPGHFDYARMNNVAAETVDADILLFLNNDTEIMTEEWLTAMLEHAQRNEVAAVGGRLFYPDGRVQHEGILVGVQGAAGNTDHGGYFDFGDVIRNVAAVTAACMMIRKEVFEKLGGFDESLQTAFNDVDLCLRALNQGLLNIYTPYARLLHFEGGSRGRVSPREDERLFRRRWLEGKDAFVDPYYNPNLDVHHPFNLRL
jgi:O-antigen biosynthesis protein